MVDKVLLNFDPAGAPKANLMELAEGAAFAALLASDDELQSRPIRAKVPDANDLVTCFGGRQVNRFVVLNFVSFDNSFVNFIPRRSAAAVRMLFSPHLSPTLSASFFKSLMDMRFGICGGVVRTAVMHSFRAHGKSELDQLDERDFDVIVKLDDFGLDLVKFRDDIVRLISQEWNLDQVSKMFDSFSRVLSCEIAEIGHNVAENGAKLDKLGGDLGDLQKDIGRIITHLNIGGPSS